MAKEVTEKGGGAWWRLAGETGGLLAGWSLGWIPVRVADRGDDERRRWHWFAHRRPGCCAAATDGTGEKKKRERKEGRWSCRRRGSPESGAHRWLTLEREERRKRKDAAHFLKTRKMI
ncbi:hypothetical protein FXO37_13201 [Capsicum annuum]|nr:hypothetical protein FXO37_13201 [Capsicum annuum]